MRTRSLALGIIAERISARQYKSGSGYMYVRTYVRSSAQARTSRRSLRRRRRLDVYARAHIQYRLGVRRRDHGQNMRVRIPSN